MNDVVHFLMGAVSGHQLAAYVLTFVMAMAEALPVAGTVVPGSAVIVGLGVLVPTGAIGVWPLLAAAILGAVAGDGASYWLGHHYQRAITGIWPFRLHPGLITRGEEFFHRHGSKGVFLARFVQGPRAFVPLAAGMMGMPARRFYTVNIASALLWAPAHILAGALLGASLQVAGAIAGRLAIVLFLAVVILWLAVWLGRRVLLRWGLPALESMQRQAVAWAAARNTWPRRQVLALLDPHHPESRPLLLGGALLFGSLWLFFSVLENVIHGEPLVRADAAVFHFLQNLRTVWVDRVMVAITELGDGTVVAAVTGMGALWLLLRRAWHTAGYWLVAVGLAELFTLLLAWTLPPSRPGAGLAAYSFPSAHTTANTVLYGFLAFLIARRLRPGRQAAVAAAASAWIAAIGFSSLYLGVHWLSDIVAGIAAGTAWVALLAISYERHQRPEVGRRGLLAVVALALLLAGAVHIGRRYASDLRRYARTVPTRTMTCSAWQAGGWRHLPARRVDLRGEKKEPLTLQWAGDLEALHRKLLAAGWREAEPWSFRSALGWLNPAAKPLQLPVLPRLEDGYPPALSMVRLSGPEDRFRIVLQVWDARVRLNRKPAPGRVRLWLGAVARQRFRHPLRLFTMVQIQPDFDAVRPLLARSLPGARLAYRQEETVAGWDGGVLLATGRGWECRGEGEMR